MKLTFVRHTSVDVPKGICYGITDVPLAETFQSESDSIRKKLEGEPFDAIYSSPLSRCVKLAIEIFPNDDFRVDHRLTELDFGDWEMTEWNVIFESAEGKSWFADYVNVRCPQGESCANLIERTDFFLSELKLNSYSNVLVFTHSGILRSMMCLLQHKTPEEAFQIPLEYGQIITFNLD